MDLNPFLSLVCSMSVCMRAAGFILLTVILAPTFSQMFSVNYLGSPNVDSWGYQLQNADIGQIANSGFDLVVMDYSRDGSEEGAYTIQDIETIKNGGVIPVAYVSIGEAEDYRFYWNSTWYDNPPDWLGHENPEWPGNYPVKFWYKSWKKIVFSYLDKIVEQGFEGVYLDKIDVFEYWSDPNNGEGFYLNESVVAGLMIAFVVEIAEYLRNISSDFLVFVQNGENILDYDYNGTFLEAISGIGVEDLWYNGVKPNPREWVLNRTRYLDIIKNSGKLVLSVDYVDDGTGYKGENKERIDDYIEKAKSKGYIPYAAKSDRELDELNIIPSVQPPLMENNATQLDFFEQFVFLGILAIAVLTLSYFVIKITKKRF